MDKKHIFDFDKVDKKEEEREVNETHLKFKCPNCGKISRDDVVFLCNHCSQTDVIYKDGVYMCPACLKPGENFECTRCGSKEVKMVK
ncbi:hypothetical protein A2716_01990 [candidate division WWE3 bacterium RIFCSPHIGHO2_01_FULL_40_23]|uniref:Uncharacterized protein n=1 Tax=candidate division WWE3 bacterium RIFCSPLOWO2_01_FULL_41_18 TaxID=1802625 RepID=A0A1F4VET1_UNCKA|nr:MAG: hypothetical protein A2716_01990 [candidate division WWE3 bacterium RIFCSPHIGHO2_01_FULL_40_23]OGC55761.1 MAG: hypothetical protein A3A78_01840 [candidate division WWE3 bacterium RIFCSPLOWO2_01_FULL_41_18]